MFRKGVIRLSSLENAGRCPRCRRFVIAEELTSHTCHIAISRAETIWFDWFSDDGFTDESSDYIRMAKGLDGTLYSLILCKHNPPCSAKRKFTDPDTKQGLYRASEEVV
jgi:hypothetical protein